MEIAVISGKGGTGKSSISAAFASCAKELVIADCDVDAANLYLLFNPSHEEEVIYSGGHKAVIDYNKCSSCYKCSVYCRFDAIKIIANKAVISETSCDGCFLCSRICLENAINMIANDKSRMYSGSFRNGKMVYGRLAPGEENSGKLVNMVREKAKILAKENNLSTIILDGPPGIGCPVISTITGVDKVIIVTEPTMSGLSDLKRAIELTDSFKITPSVIINKFDINIIMSNEISDYCKNSGIANIWKLPYDKKMTAAMVQAKTIIEYDEKAELSRLIKSLYNNIID